MSIYDDVHIIHIDLLASDDGIAKALDVLGH
jgi:hypothetical protein